MKPHLIIIALFFSLICQAQSKFYVRGYVMDESKRAIDLANISEKGTTNGCSSNENGFYELALTPADSFTIVFSCIGYESIERTFKSSGQSVNINVILPTTSTQIGDVEVRAHRRQTSTMQTIDTDKFRLMPDASGGNIESLLVTFAVVSSTNELSSQYSVRGGNYDENSVYVNGIEVYRPLLVRSGQQEGLSFINPDMVNSVEFSAGGFDSKFGDKMSSVLNITYKKPEKFEAATSVSLLGASAYVGSAGKKFTQMHGIRYKTSAYLLGSLDTKGEYSPWFVDYQTYLTYRFNPKWEITFLGNISQNTYRFIPKERETSFGTLQMSRNFKVYFDGMENDIFRTFFGAFTTNYKPSKNVDLSFMLSAFNTNEQETYDITGQYWLADLDLSSADKTDKAKTTLGVGTYHEHARNRLSATVANFSHMGEFRYQNNTLQWGVGAQEEIIFDRIQEWEFRDSAGYSMPYNPNRVELIYNLTSHIDMYSTRLTAYVQDVYKLRREHGLWSFTGGLRANWWSYNKEFLISPRGTVTYFPKWKQDFNFRFAAGLYYQTPFYKEILRPVTDINGNTTMMPNAAIKAQRSLHLVLGADYFFRLWNRPFKLTAEAYYKPADHIISYYVDNVRIRYAGENNAKAYTTGIDLKLFGEFVPGTDSWISFSWMKSKEDVLDDSYEVYSNKGNHLGTVYPKWISRPNEQRYSVSIFFQDYFPNHPEYKVHLKFIWADGLPFGPPRSERYQAVLRTKPYRRVDIGASRGFMQGREKFMSKQDVVKSFWINLEFFNLLNIKNVNSYYWVTDIYNQQFAVPNYLTGFMVNLRVTVDF